MEAGLAAKKITKFLEWSVGHSHIRIEEYDTRTLSFSMLNHNKQERRLYKPERGNYYKNIWKMGGKVGKRSRIMLVIMAFYEDDCIVYYLWSRLCYSQSII